MSSRGSGASGRPSRATGTSGRSGRSGRSGGSARTPEEREVVLARRALALAQRQESAAHAAWEAVDARSTAASRAAREVRRRVVDASAAGLRQQAEQDVGAQRLAHDEAEATRRASEARAALAPIDAEYRRAAQESDRAYDQWEGLRRGTPEAQEADRVYMDAVHRAEAIRGQQYQLREKAMREEMAADRAREERERLITQRVDEGIAAHPDVHAAASHVAVTTSASHDAYQRLRSAQSDAEQAHRRLQQAERTVARRAGTVPGSQRAPAAIFYADTDAADALRETFSYSLTPHEISALSGAAHGDRVVVSAAGSSWHAGVRVDVRGAHVSREFTVRQEHGLVVVHDHITHNLGEKTGSSGRKIIAGFEGMRTVGVDLLVAQAARASDLNGYYTWARLGFMGDIPHAILHEAQQRFASGITRVEDLMQEPGGAQWWKQHGDSWDATFDFRPGSYSMRVLDRFKRALR